MPYSRTFPKKYGGPREFEYRGAKADIIALLSEHSGLWYSSKKISSSLSLDHASVLIWTTYLFNDGVIKRRKIERRVSCMFEHGYIHKDSKRSDLDVKQRVVSVMVNVWKVIGKEPSTDVLNKQWEELINNG